MMGNKEYLIQQGDKTLLRVYIKASAQKSEFIGIYGEPKRLKIAIKSLPIEGKANKELIRFIAKSFDIKLSSVCIVWGQTSRSKDLLLNLPLSSISHVLEKF